MDYIIKIAENENAVLKIIQDTDATNPRVDMDNFGHMVCWHSRYSLGDDHSYSDQRELFEDLAYSHIGSLDMDEYDDNDLLNIIEDNYLILPLYLFDHSGITMNTTGFSSRWDSGQVGWTYVSHDEIKREYGKLDLEKAEKLLIAEVEIFDQYIKGEIYGYILEEKKACTSCQSVEYNEVDSCWGFYGLDYLEDELKLQFNSKYDGLADKLTWAN